MLRIYLLGEFQLIAGDKAVTSIDLPRLRSLLAYLVLHQQMPQPRSQLAYLLWPDSTEAQAHTNLRTLIHRLRNALPDADHFLRRDRLTLHWQPDSPWTLDALEFEQAIARAEQAQKRHDKTEARVALSEAVVLYRGDLLPDCYDEWILPERDRLHQLFLSALERLIILLEGERDYQAAIATAQRLLRYDPLQEAAYRHLMRIHAASGDRAAALRVYHSCATILERELGAEPGRAIREAYERLIQAEVDEEDEQQPGSQARGAGPLLVGRQQEWQRLLENWRSAIAGHPHMIVLAGEAGIGKTRLAEELKAWVDRQGIATAVARCYAAEGDLAYAPVLSWLRADVIKARVAVLDETWRAEVVRLVPDLFKGQQSVRPTAMPRSLQRQHMFEALARALLGKRQPLLLFLDDVQWCDHETLEWLHYLLRFDAQARILLVCTLRPEEIEADHPLHTLLGALGRERRVTELALNSLDTADTALLAGQVAGQRLDELLVEKLYRETEGNPLFVIEMIRTGLASGSYNERAVPTGQLSLLSPTVHAVIAARLAQLSPQALELAALAGVIGRGFTFDVLLSASGQDEDMVVRALDELWQRRIVREQNVGDIDTYDFSHERLREGAYATLSTARRRLFHRRVAATLESVHAGVLDTVCLQIATHYERAGSALKAAQYYKQAGEVARLVYANADAQVSFQRALRQLETLQLDPAQQEFSAHLQERIGDIFALSGQYAEACNVYQQALTYILPPLKQARLYRRIAKTWEVRQRREEALENYEMAERALGEEPAETDEIAEAWWGEWIRVQLDRLWLHHGLAQIEEMEPLVERVKPAVECYGTASQQAIFLIYVTLMYLIKDRYVVSQEAFESAYAAWGASHKSISPNAIALALSLLAFCHMLSGDFSTAEEQAQAALAVAERIGAVTTQSQCLAYLTCIYRRQGRVEEVRQYCMRSKEKASAGQLQENVALAHAHFAWIAWREKKMAEVEREAQRALKIWQQIRLVYPFHWTALWPLIALAHGQQRLELAIDYTKQLLAPSQERLLDPIQKELEAMLRAWDDSQLEETNRHLQLALELAQEQGYL